MTVNISVLNGTLQKDVEISLSTENSTAICKPKVTVQCSIILNL